MHFFFSYSRDDAGDEYLRRFYHALRAEVRTRGGVSLEETGFLDIEQPTGRLWPQTTGDALGRCAVLIPIYSPHFFSSHTCGQEWSAFAARSANLPGSGTQAPKCILPVWWVPPRAEPPAVAKYLEDTRDQFGDDYRKFGLRYLMQLSKNKDLYHDFLVKFTGMLLRAAEDPPPTREITNLLSEPNAFALKLPETARPANGAAGGRGGPRHVTFIFTAAGQAEMHGIRTKLDSYGRNWRDWSPYLPDCPHTAAFHAQGIAISRNMTSALLPTEESIFEVLEKARESRELVIFVIDPWAARLPGYSSLLGRLDLVRSGNAAVVVPWESHDIRASSDGKRTRDNLFAVLGNWISAGAPSFQDDIGSVGEFEDILGKVLVMIRAQVINRADMVARVTEQGPMSRPILNGTRD
jgi:FxsC-like protein